jgi:hypothetical protein
LATFIKNALALHRDSGLAHQTQRQADPAVGDAQIRIGHLQHGHAQALPKGNIGQLHVFPLLDGIEQPRRLAGQGQAAPVSEAKLLQVPVELGRAELQPDLGRADIARIADDLAHGQVFVLVRVLDPPPSDAPLPVLAEVLLGRGADLSPARPPRP